MKNNIINNFLKQYDIDFLHSGVPNKYIVDYQVIKIFSVNIQKIFDKICHEKPTADTIILNTMTLCLQHLLKRNFYIGT